MFAEQEAGAKTKMERDPTRTQPGRLAKAVAVVHTDTNTNVAQKEEM